MWVWIVIELQKTKDGMQPKILAVRSDEKSANDIAYADPTKWCNIIKIKVDADYEVRNTL